MAETYDVIVLVPIRDESAIISRTMDLLTDFLKTRPWFGRRSAIVIAENGSRESSETIIRAHPSHADHRIEYFSCRAPGRGAAIREAMTRYQADQYVLLDADLPLELVDLEAVCEPVRSGKADVVVGKRTGARPFRRRCMTLGWRLICQRLFGPRISDFQCSIVSFASRAARLVSEHCREDGWFLNTELIVLAYQSGLMVQDAPIRWIEQRFPGRRSKVSAVRDCLKGFQFILAFSRRLDESLPTAERK